MTKPRFMKEMWFPRPHNCELRYSGGLEDTHISTIVPLVMYDEGLGDPASYNSNPEHASFAETDAPNCYPESSLQNIHCAMEVRMLKNAIETDKAPVIKAGFQVIAVSFEDLAATEEKTSETIGDLLDLTSESTDRQTYPNWNGTDVTVYGVGTHADLPASVPGLTTDQSLEHVTYDDDDIDRHYDVLQYYKLKNKYMKVQSGIKWFNLTKYNPVRRFNIHLRTKTKFLNEYAFLGVRTILPNSGSKRQYIASGDTGASEHVDWYFNCRYDEWHPDFDHKRV